MKINKRIANDVKENIYRARVVQKLNQADFGAKYGYKQSTVAGWESGRKKISAVLYLHILADYHAWSKARWAARP